jgi:hypothetical protein
MRVSADMTWKGLICHNPEPSAGQAASSRRPGLRGATRAIADLLNTHPGVLICRDAGSLGDLIAELVHNPCSNVMMSRCVRVTVVFNH